MADLPIPYQPPMIRALLEERKTQTRRTFDQLRRFGKIREFGRSDVDWYDWHFRDEKGRMHYLSHEELFAVLKYRVGDRLYVREHWRTVSYLDYFPPSALPLNSPIFFIADLGDATEPKHGRFRQGMHMPKWASRLTQIVNDVRVERLQEISTDDAISEGLIKMPFAPAMAVEMGCNWGFEGDARHGSPVSAYAALWDHINGEGAWDDNPFVAVYTVSTIKSNIDQIGGDA